MRFSIVASSSPLHHLIRYMGEIYCGVVAVGVRRGGGGGVDMQVVTLGYRCEAWV